MLIGFFKSAFFSGKKYALKKYATYKQRKAHFQKKICQKSFLISVPHVQKSIQKRTENNFQKKTCKRMQNFDDNLFRGKNIKFRIISH